MGFDLFQIPAIFQELGDVLGSGETPSEDLQERIKQLTSEGPKAIEQFCDAIKEQELAAEAIATRIKELENKKKNKLRAAEQLRTYLQEILETYFNGACVAGVYNPYVRSNKKVSFELYDDATIEKLPIAFVRVKKELDKTALREAYKDGELPEGIQVVESDERTLVIS